jgi:hypothetical protein
MDFAIEAQLNILCLGLEGRGLAVKRRGVSVAELQLRMLGVPPKEADAISNRMADRLKRTDFAAASVFDLIWKLDLKT